MFFCCFSFSFTSSTQWNTNHFKWNRIETKNANTILVFLSKNKISAHKSNLKKGIFQAPSTSQSIWLSTKCIEQKNYARGTETKCRSEASRQKPKQQLTIPKANKLSICAGFASAVTQTYTHASYTIKFIHTERHTMLSPLSHIGLLLLACKRLWARSADSLLCVWV